VFTGWEICGGFSGETGAGLAGSDIWFTLVDGATGFTRRDGDPRGHEYTVTDAQALPVAFFFVRLRLLVGDGVGLVEPAA